MKKSIYYWSPCLTKVGTVKSTLNSAISVAKYSKEYEVKILDVFGEWTPYKEYLSNNGVEVEKLTFNYHKFLPKNGFFKSRLSYLIIILVSIFPLIFFLKRKKPNYLIIHLITFLPLLLFNFLKLQTKLILRISGYPKLNILRKKLWKISEKKIFKITCPTSALVNDLEKIFKLKKIKLLSDAIINMKEFSKKKYIDWDLKPEKSKGDFFLAAGRFTKQKNFIYLIREFKKFSVQYPNEKLIILGEGELRDKMFHEIKKLRLNNNIKILSYTNNIYSYMRASKAFILSSLWEEVGFVIVEAALSNCFVISSNCNNGPKEFLMNGKAGILFENNLDDKLFEGLKKFQNLEKNDLSQKKLSAKKNCIKFTMFHHFLNLKKIIQNP
tara:strand:+ start:10679 stop:11827 length:1149 start_codon:yes stop_codon:yes gene_type:complete